MVVLDLLARLILGVIFILSLIGLIKDRRESKGGKDGV